MISYRIFLLREDNKASSLNQRWFYFLDPDYILVMLGDPSLPELIPLSERAQAGQLTCQVPADPNIPDIRFGNVMGKMIQVLMLCLQV